MTSMLASALVVGFLGSLHCLAMCGPLVCAFAGTGVPGTHRRMVLFFVGKTLTYASLGAVAGAAHLALDRGGVAPWVSGALGLLAGLATIGFGALSLRRAAIGAARGSGATLVALGAKPRRHQSLAACGFGALTGLLPCGLVYAMLAQAVTASTPAGGAALMACFGLGTVPSLALAAGAGRWIRQRLGERAPQLAAWTVIALGAVTLTRAAVGLVSFASGGSCCGAS